MAVACERQLSLSRAYLDHPNAERAELVLDASRAVTGRTVAFLDASPTPVTRRRRAA